MLDLAVTQAYLALFILCLPVCIWVCYTDLSSMKIRNEAVYALVAIFIVAGLLVIPFGYWLWRWVSLVVVLLVGIILNQTAKFGAGDAKFAAAAAPFVAQNLLDIELALILLSLFMIATLVLHRIFRAIPAVRRATPDWTSWQRTSHVPVGVALAATLSVYLAMKAFPAFYQAFAGLIG